MLRRHFTVERPIAGDQEQCDPVAPILDPKEQDVHLQHWYASGKYETLRSSDGQKKIGFPKL